MKNHWLQTLEHLPAHGVFKPYDNEKGFIKILFFLMIYTLTVL